MNIGEKFTGPKCFAILYDERKKSYLLLSEFNPKKLDLSISIHVNAGLKTIARYNGVNVDGFDKLTFALYDLNEGKKVNLENLLK